MYKEMVDVEMVAEETVLPVVKVRRVQGKWVLRAAIAGRGKGARVKQYDSSGPIGFGPYPDEATAKENAQAFAKYVVAKSTTAAAPGRHSVLPKTGELPSGQNTCCVSAVACY